MYAVVWGGQHGNVAGFVSEHATEEEARAEAIRQQREEENRQVSYYVVSRCRECGRYPGEGCHCR